MIAFVLTVLLMQPAKCPADGAALLGDAEVRARHFDVAGALELFDRAGARGCEDGVAAAHYLRGLRASREAYAAGGSASSLAPVMEAERALGRSSAAGTLRAEIARVVLLAAAAAAQSERDDLGTFIDHARDLERRQISAGQSGAFAVSAHEAAGDLWLQVHRFDAARQAYRAAADTIGATPRVALGLARVAVRSNDMASACGSYRELLRLWGTRPALPPEIVEARDFLGSKACGTSGAPGSR